MYTTAKFTSVQAKYDTLVYWVPSKVILKYNTAFYIIPINDTSFELSVF